MGRSRWSPQTVVAVLLVALLAACGGDVSERPESRSNEPYAGLDERRIRALSPERVADLLAGRGAGYALAAELNDYPGPMDVLDLAEELELTPRQRRLARTLEAVNHRQASALGRRLVRLETELDRAFRARMVSGTLVERLTSEIATIEGRLRAVHLRAHLAMRDALEPGQVARYAELRGYVRSGHHPATAGKHGS